MTTVSSLPTSRRQILVALGNRYAVFGPSPGLPQALQFDPATDSTVLPPVDDESEGAEARIAQTLRVSGMRKSPADQDSSADVELVDDDGNRVLVDVKVREHDPKTRELDQARDRLVSSRSTGEALEIWYFNIERIRLIIMRLDKGQLRIEELAPLDVWERTAEGIFGRARVLDEVNDWVSRVTALYEDVREWLADNKPALRCEQSRTVTMSEEMMQLFGVTDREIPILDVLEADQVIASFVPRGLWLVGSWGRIDVITRNRTEILMALGGPGNLEWRLTSPENRLRSTPFGMEALLAIVTQS
jgi:hypothetical protein